MHFLVAFQIAAVCDFFTYIRYVNNGIVKSGVHDSYWDIICLRKNMTLARLGLNFIAAVCDFFTYIRYVNNGIVKSGIAAVCDFFTYIRYVNNGIVKSGVHDSYWDIICLRKNMTLARLGLNFVTKIGGSQTSTS
ncbi:unnamed protein product [Gongylonema pulchrum]|uniref:7TM_GPCR_Srx domain-containing protein n=1 Tax=Gongylonema pulchrum TaxID=637853 RepID=A0A183E2J1_9BILA|nr:unnamed protein product [Gongylonema pulchrum]